MYATVIVFIGLCALVLVSLSWVRNIRYMRSHIKKRDFMPSDLYIDYPIRVLWLVYITIFSVGFIVNNLFVP